MVNKSTSQSGPAPEEQGADAPLHCLSEKEGKSVHHYDATGMRCPMPVLRARRLLTELSEGEILCLRTSDPSSMKDVPAFCRMAGHKLIIAQSNETQTSFLFEIERGPDKESFPSEEE